MFVDVTGGKLVGGLFATLPILNRINFFTDENQGNANQASITGKLT